MNPNKICAYLYVDFLKAFDYTSDNNGSPEAVCRSTEMPD